MVSIVQPSTYQKYTTESLLTAPTSPTTPTTPTSTVASTPIPSSSSSSSSPSLHESPLSTPITLTSEQYNKSVLDAATTNLLNKFQIEIKPTDYMFQKMYSPPSSPSPSSNSSSYMRLTSLCKHFKSPVLAHHQQENSRYKAQHFLFQTLSVEQQQQQQQQQCLMSVFHETYIMLCLLDDLFKYDILDIDTITSSHEYLKSEFHQIKYWDLSRVNFHVRKYLEFLRIINPVDEESQISLGVDHCNNNNNNIANNKTVKIEDNADCWFINNEIPRIVKMYIKSTIVILEKCLDLMIYESSAMDSVYNAIGTEGYEKNYTCNGGDEEVSHYMV
ncbi:hypothetical protein PVL30_004882 [Lodderomyces elongisporus]|uniref:uncharacterized protein n=1 Tax=Lodderomyces elongisporus TaxID=36914 RepID=UPI0029224FA3|nr:uncharacterized protein PVL30_004882 [Lodderomyces elongisporus]WLF81086.1 hypothetical protein PVL30_004882 [Lodderomyces elongisporus]